jgi:hypothetical protein
MKPPTNIRMYFERKDSTLWLQDMAVIAVHNPVLYKPENGEQFAVVKDPLAAHSTRLLQTRFTPASEARHRTAAASGATIRDEAARRCVIIFLILLSPSRCPMIPR